MLVTDHYYVLLDCEMQRPGEREVTCSLRLLERVMKEYPKAFQVVVADALYAEAPFFKRVLQGKKELIVVLKDERRDLVQDALSLMKLKRPKVVKEKKKEIRLWEVEGLESWWQLKRKVRVVRSVEVTQVKRQKNDEEEAVKSEWLWVTTLSKEQAPVKAILKMGHQRWAIENQGFNELVNEWHADHVYKHDVNAMEAFWLTLMLAYNLFHAFLRLNLRPELKAKHTVQYFCPNLLTPLPFKKSMPFLTPLPLPSLVAESLNSGLAYMQGSKVQL